MMLTVQEAAVKALYQWQTLIAGLLALVAIVWLQRQISFAREQENERRERQHFAARATMPAALNDVVDYAKAGIEALKTVPRPTGNSALIAVPLEWTPPKLPGIPSEAVAVLRTCIESADYGPRKEIAKLLSDLQICNSRLYDLFEETLSPQGRARRSATSYNMQLYFGDFLELYLRCDRMFRYARGEQPEIALNITLGDMTTRAVFADLEGYPGLTEALTKRYGYCEV
jgi:hypothetical protein